MKRSYENSLRCKFDGSAISSDKSILQHLNVYHKYNVPASALLDINLAKQFFQTKEEYHRTQKQIKELNKALKPLDADKLFSDTVHFYVDKKKYTLEQANEIAAKIVEREKAKRIGNRQPSTGGLLV